MRNNQPAREMKTIHKYHIEKSIETIELPIGAEILSVGSQSLEDLFLWAAVDTLETTEMKTFEVFGTGWPMSDEDRRYIGTAHTQTGFVFHIFEKNPHAQHGDE